MLVNVPFSFCLFVSLLVTNRFVCLFVYRGAIIKRRLRKVDPFRPVAFARKAQEQYIRVNLALKKYTKIGALIPIKGCTGSFI